MPLFKKKKKETEKEFYARKRKDAENWSLNEKAKFDSHHAEMGRRYTEDAKTKRKMIFDWNRWNERLDKLKTKGKKMSRDEKKDSEDLIWEIKQVERNAKAMGFPFKKWKKTKFTIEEAMMSDEFIGGNSPEIIAIQQQIEILQQESKQKQGEIEKVMPDMEKLQEEINLLINKRNVLLKELKHEIAIFSKHAKNINKETKRKLTQIVQIVGGHYDTMANDVDTEVKKLQDYIRAEIFNILEIEKLKIEVKNINIVIEGKNKLLLSIVQNIKQIQSEIKTKGDEILQKEEEINTIETKNEQAEKENIEANKLGGKTPSKKTPKKTPKKTISKKSPLISKRKLKIIERNLKTASILLGSNCRNCVDKLLKHLNYQTNLKVIDLPIYINQLEQITRIGVDPPTGGQCKMCGGKSLKRGKNKIRKHQGINKKTGKLKKGYKYSGKKIKSGLRKIVQTKSTCKGHLSAKINKNIHEKKYKNKKQAIAVAFSQVKKERPGCKRVLKKKKRVKKGGSYQKSFQYCKKCQ